MLLLPKTKTINFYGDHNCNTHTLVQDKTFNLHGKIVSVWRIQSPLLFSSMCVPVCVETWKKKKQGNVVAFRYATVRETESRIWRLTFRIVIQIAKHGKNLLRLE